MLPITLNFPYNKEKFVKLQTVLWKISQRKVRKNLLFLSIYFALFLLVGILSINENEPASPFLFLSIGFGLYHLLVLYGYFKRKKKYYRNLNKIAEKYELEQMDCQFTFCEENIKYSDKEKKFELNWSVIVNFSIYKNYLLINLGDNLITSFIFDKEELDIIDYDSLLKILTNKLPEVKIDL